MRIAGGSASSVTLRTLHDEFEACENAMPAADLIIDTENTPPEIAAKEIFALVGRLLAT